MHMFLIGFGLGMFLMFQWDSGDWSRGRDRAGRVDRTPAADTGDLTTMDGCSGIPPRCP